MKLICLIFVILFQAQAQMVEIHTPNFSKKKSAAKTIEQKTPACEATKSIANQENAVCGEPTALKLKKKLAKPSLAKEKAKTKTKTQ